MASYDIVEAAGNGYSVVWRERSYLFHLATIPMGIKYLCFMSISLLGWTNEYIRQSFIMLPSYFADGWMLSHFVRLIFFGQRWPFRPTGDTDKDLIVLEDRARGIMSGMLTFVVVQFVIDGMTQLMYTESLWMSQEGSELERGQSIAVLLAGVAGIWGVRFVWYFIPAALGYSLRRFTYDIRSFSTSLYMIGTWLLCALPLFIFFLFVAIILTEPYGTDPRNLPLFVQLGKGVAETLADTTISLIVTGGIACGLRAFYINAGNGGNRLH